MRFIGSDTETHLIRPGCQFPPLVCVSHAQGPRESPFDRSLYTSEAGSLGQVGEYFCDTGVVQVFHNAKFDLGVLLAHDLTSANTIFSAVASNRVTCTLLREKLLNNYSGALQSMPRIRLESETVGPYSLAGLVYKYFGEDISEGKKEGAWRLRYRELDGIPLELWPVDAMEYAKSDADWALRVYYAQEDAASALCHGSAIFADQFRRVQADFALALMSAWGIQVDGERVQRVADQLRVKLARGDVILKTLGLLRESGSVNKSEMQVLVTECYRQQSKSVPKTDKGAVKTDRETLLGSGHDLLIEYAALGRYRTLLNTFIPAISLPRGHPIHPSYNVMVATGRTSASRPNVQNIPRASGEVGLRECFIPRPGRVFVACDYDTCELRTLAQVLKDKVGFSRLADAYVKDPALDPHLEFARSMVGHGAWEGLDAGEKKLARTRAKAASFGFPGGLGIDTFRTFAAGYGLALSPADAKRLKKAFLLQWPELKHYFAQNSAEVTADNGLIEHARSGRFRGGCSYTQLCNTPFQGAAADGALRALFRLAHECFCDVQSALYNSRPILFIHDEIVLSVPEVGASVHHAAIRLQELMVESMEEFTPDVPARATAVAMRRWSKDADRVIEGGFLVPWTENTPSNQTLCV